MKLKFKKTLVGLVIALAALLIFVLVSWLWLSVGTLTPAKEAIYSRLPFPAAIVNGHPISIKTYIQRYRLSEAAAQKTGQPMGDLKTAVLTRLIQETELDILASQKSVAPNQAQLDREFLAEQAQNPNLIATLASYGLSQEDYKNQLLKSSVAATNLTVWFYGQRTLNVAAYQQADDILAKLNSGGKFGDLAKTYSQDQASKVLGGDEGFLDLGQILPEVQNAFLAAPLGQTKIVATRFGVEIIRLVDKDNQGQNGQQRLHLQQIYLPGSDFNAWYLNETKNFKIIKIVAL